MLRIVAWIAAACLVVILVMALLRGRGSEPERATIAPPEGAAAAAPAVIAPSPTPAPKVEAPKTAPVAPPDIDQQVRDDAAAVGMTTAPEPDSTPSEEPPT